MIDLLWVDADVVVANKPSGLLVHRGMAADDDTALFRVRDALGEQVHPVHRLDRGTSGALVFARTRAAAASLSRAFEEGGVDKRYMALVRGVPPVEGVIDHPVPPGEGLPRVRAVTRYALVAASPVDRCAWVEARPETGRFHQVRRHMKHLGHPLIGDVNYGSGMINRHYRATYDLHRLALHASFVAFAHPATGRRVEVRAPTPDDLLVPLGRLRLVD
ncbi:MAG: pseudouridine synthase [Polyangiaceae bacterium]|nr:pseudouridine synthase [Polyangiaceae bacterium]